MPHPDARKPADFDPAGIIRHPWQQLGVVLRPRAEADHGADLHGRLPFANLIVTKSPLLIAEMPASHRARTNATALRIPAVTIPRPNGSCNPPAPDTSPRSI